MSDNTVKFGETIETEYGEKTVLDSPYEAKGYLNALPFQPDDDFDESRLEEDDDVPAFNFPDEFGAFQTWDADNSRWMVAADSVDVLKEYFEEAGFDVEIEGQATL